jgi:hypothetical protein
MPEPCFPATDSPQVRPLGERLFLEVEQSFETVSGIVDEYGAMTLVDLWWLAHVLVANPDPFIGRNSGSRIRELIERLPSAKEFARYLLPDEDTG